MLPGSYPHRKYMVCMLGNIIKLRWEEMLPMRDKRQQTTEDRATQPMEAGGWVSQIDFWKSQNYGEIICSDKNLFAAFYPLRFINCPVN